MRGAGFKSDKRVTDEGQLAGKTVKRAAFSRWSAAMTLVFEDGTFLHCKGQHEAFEADTVVMALDAEFDMGDARSYGLISDGDYAAHRAAEKAEADADAARRKREMFERLKREFEPPAEEV